MTNAVLLNNVEHRDLRVVTERASEFGHNTWYALMFPLEFRALQGQYPIFFQRDAASGKFFPLALLGLQPGENLFLRDGHWASSYVPLTIRLGPFLIGRQNFVYDGVHKSRRVIHIDLDSPRVSRERGEALFLEYGGNSPYLDSVADMLDAIHHGIEQSEKFIRALQAHGLLESFTLDVTLDSGEANQLGGFYTVDEERLRGLSSEDLNELHREGFLEAIYMVMASQSQLRRLIDERTAGSPRDNGGNMGQPFIETANLRSADEIGGIAPDNVLSALAGVDRPLILRGYCERFPAVRAATESARAMADYLLDHYSGVPVNGCYGSADTGGRVFYNDDMSGFNFQTRRTELGQLLDDILATAQSGQMPMRYMPSSEVTHWFPRFAAENDAGLQGVSPLGSLWLGNKVRVAAHYDFPNNLACNIAGRRRFTLLPPEQIANLYPGPLEFAPGGQEISLVDFYDPDFKRFPRFRQALDHALVAELAPGDALFLPGMWWHHVECLDALNVLYTHWWRDSAAFMGRPTNALLHAILGLRNLPEHQRKAWKALFSYYIFDADEGAAEHIEPSARGILQQPMSLDAAMQLRAKLQNDLKR